MRNADDTIRWNSSWRRASYPSSSFFFDRDSGAAYRWADGRGIITKQELLEWGESRYGGQRVTLQRVRGSESGEGRREKSEMKRACRIALFKPNKICGIIGLWNYEPDLSSGRCAHVSTLHLPQGQRWEKGRMDVCVCVCMYICVYVCVERRKNDVYSRWIVGKEWRAARTGTEVRECTGKCACELPANLATISPHRCRHCAELQLSIVGHVSKDWK